jgi:hypothetical protein
MSGPVRQSYWTRIPGSGIQGTVDPPCPDWYAASANARRTVRSSPTKPIRHQSRVGHVGADLAAPVVNPLLDLLHVGVDQLRTARAIASTQGLRLATMRPTGHRGRRSERYAQIGPKTFRIADSAGTVGGRPIPRTGSVVVAGLGERVGFATRAACPRGSTASTRTLWMCTCGSGRAARPVGQASGGVERQGRRAPLAARRADPVRDRPVLE